MTVCSGYLSDLENDVLFDWFNFLTETQNLHVDLFGKVSCKLHHIESWLCFFTLTLCYVELPVMLSEPKIETCLVSMARDWVDNKQIASTQGTILVVHCIPTASLLRPSFLC